MRLLVPLLPLISLTLLAACGTRGPLELPPGPPPAPLFGNPAPVSSNAGQLTPAPQPQPQATPPDNSNKPEKQ